MHSKPKAHDNDGRVLLWWREETAPPRLTINRKKKNKEKQRELPIPKTFLTSLLFHQLSYQGPQTVLRSMCDADDDVLAKRHGGSFLGNKCYYYYFSSELNSKRNLSSPLLIPLILFSVLVKGSSCSFIGCVCKERLWNDVVFIWSHILRKVHEMSQFLGTSWNISCFNDCWFELVVRGRAGIRLVTVLLLGQLS